MSWLDSKTMRPDKTVLSVASLCVLVCVVASVAAPAVAATQNSTVSTSSNDNTTVSPNSSLTNVSGQVLTPDVEFETLSGSLTALFRGQAGDTITIQVNFDSNEDRQMRTWVLIGRAGNSEVLDLVEITIDADKVEKNAAFELNTFLIGRGGEDALKRGYEVVDTSVEGESGPKTDIAVIRPRSTDDPALASNSDDRELTVVGLGAAYDAARYTWENSEDPPTFDVPNSTHGIVEPLDPSSYALRMMSSPDVRLSDDTTALEPKDTEDTATLFLKASELIFEDPTDIVRVQAGQQVQLVGDFTAGETYTLHAVSQNSEGDLVVGSTVQRSQATMDDSLALESSSLAGTYVIEDDSHELTPGDIVGRSLADYGGFAIEISESRTVDGTIETYVAPDDAVLDSVSAIENNAHQTDEVGQSSSSVVATGDQIVFELDMSDSVGSVDSVDDLTDSDSVHLSVGQTETAPSNQPYEWGLTEASHLVEDPGTSTYYVVTDMSQVEGLDTRSGDRIPTEDYNEFQATLSTDGQQTDSGMLTVEPRYAFFDNLDEESQLILPAENDVTVTGTTTLAPDSQFTIELMNASAGPSKFIRSVDVTVSPDRTWEAESIDFADPEGVNEAVEPGTMFTGQALENGASLVPPRQATTIEQTSGVAIGGEIVALDASVTLNEQQTGGEVITVASATLSQGGFVILRDSGGDVLGVSNHISGRETVSDLRVLLDEPLASGTQVTAMVHWDRNHNSMFDADTDQPYMSDGVPVTDSAQVTTAGPDDVTGDGHLPTDPDEDGAYEDVNGDGEFTATDVQALFANMDSDAVQNNPELFDFNGDGNFSVSDVQALFAQSL